ncbi:MAG: hypothetical protein COT81_04550 [Candidatus Buchananbacteria bacterium CG10_big_fil_rev_8_21_14_0_10_42_9]|uniref:DUF5667 domain-containing protein n=1 Tax=Candidatus Buchananbacteria bacterium CG10_big_fil_rev_8_21_14_0_10_42_9 TaxID=1974526 RepID=A0A2H0W0A1_9BACT|nr:MAG: hypothetical protein COT81_04550 [Candidatus Buchananbacteria bacterium CG10_big_fil_rev_8_21_14_0_10_42_9]
MTDQKLIQKLKQLRSVKPRSEWVHLNRDFLMSEIQVSAKTKAGLGKSLEAILEGVLGQFRHVIMQPAVAMLVMLAVFTSSTLAVNGAFYSLPGDSLYPVKLGLEKLQVAVNIADEEKATLRLEFARNRLNELDRLVAQNDNGELDQHVNALLSRFNQDISLVRAHVERQSEQGNVLKLAQSVDSNSTEFAKKLKANKSKIAKSSESKSVLDQATAEAESTSLAALRAVVDDSSDGTLAIAMVGGRIDTVAAEIEALAASNNSASAQAEIDAARLLLDEGDVDGALDKLESASKLVNQPEEELDEGVSEGSEDAETETEVNPELEAAADVIQQATSTDIEIPEEVVSETTEELIGE